jgi:hypothetical protein
LYFIDNNIKFIIVILIMLDFLYEGIVSSSESSDDMELVSLKNVKIRRFVIENEYEYSEYEQEDKFLISNYYYKIRMINASQRKYEREIQMALDKCFLLETPEFDVYDLVENSDLIKKSPNIKVKEHISSLEKGIKSIKRLEKQKQKHYREYLTRTIINVKVNL